MAKPPKLDLARLRREVRSAQADGRVGAAGTFAAVRAALPTIEVLRAEGASWRVIANALAAQGVTQGVGDESKPITRSRLTAIVSELQAQKRREAAKQEGRRERRDIVPLASNTRVSRAPSPQQEPISSRPGTTVKHRKLQLAAELDVKPNNATPSDQTDAPDVEALRRADFNNVRRLFKDGT